MSMLVRAILGSIKRALVLINVTPGSVSLRECWDCF